MPDKKFETWTHNGKRFLGVIQGESHVAVLDDDGNFYGGWFSVKEFRDRQTGKKGAEKKASTEEILNQVLDLMIRFVPKNY